MQKEIKTSGQARFMENQPHPFGLALGGGAALGGAHIGVLRALDELGIRIDLVAGTSIGALIGALFAFGKSWEEIREIALNLDWLDASNLSLSNGGLLSNQELGELLRSLLGEAKFAEAEIPLAVEAADISTGEKVVLREGDVARAVRASTSIPGVFTPVEIDGRLLVDGGVLENVPLTPLQEQGADFLICVNLGPGLKKHRPDSILEVMLRAFYYSVESTTRLQVEEADVLIDPDLREYSLVDTSQTADLIERGYRESRKRLKEWQDRTPQDRDLG